MNLELQVWLTLALTLLLRVHSLLAFEITGATGAVDPSTGARPFRTEISRFSQPGPSWDLYLLALFDLQRVNQSDPWSYFQIAGIHGLPQIPYDGVQGAGSYSGYCMHAAVPFVTWHRPYLALYEEAIWNRAQYIAAQYPPNYRDQYQAAADALRIPFWDWATTPNLPDVVTFPTISVNTPDGNRSISNPLYAYIFQSDAAGNGFPLDHPMSNFSNTLRWWSGASPNGNQSAATTALMANAPSILSLTYQLFSTVTNFTTFSCTLPGGQPNVADNVENIHNSIHNSVGGWGHMSFPEVAAFDPIFWLHHANVDRLFALWQALNPDSWMIPTTNGYGSYYESPGTVDSSSSPLAPFHADNGTTLFTSDDVRSTARFGYAYPELPDWSMNATDLMNYARQQINRLYNPSPSQSRKRPRSLPLRRAADLASAFSYITLDDARRLGVNNADRQWFAKINIDRFAYDTSFALYFFIGDPPPDVTSWPSAPNLIGTQGQFINADVASMHPEDRPQGALEGQMSLTHTLVAGMNRGFIADLSPDSVIPVLQRGLHWRASSADGCEINILSLTGLLVSVGSRSVQPVKDNTCFPTYGAVEWHGNVTQGKPGGATQYYRLVR